MTKRQKYLKEYYQKNKHKWDTPEKRLYQSNWQKEWRKRHPEYAKEVGEKLRQQRRRVVEHYGGMCICCGEDIYAFLAIDHINGNGNKHRKEIRQRNISSWIVKNKFPPEFQILCHNCNMAKSILGICPHQINRLKHDEKNV